MSENEASAKVVSVNVNPKGGVPKDAVPSARITATGVEGDRQRDRRFHGGPARAVSLYSADVIGALRDEGHPISAGSTGENLTISGLVWGELGVGSRLSVGEVELEITGYAAPCKIIAESFAEGQFARISQKVHPGWSRLYARVLREGVVRPGDHVVVCRAAASVTEGR